MTQGESEILYGRRAVAEAERGSRRVIEVWRSPEVPDDDLERLCGSTEHQGVVARVERFRYEPVDRLLEAEDALVLALDEVQDPQNLGAICRAGEVLGASALVICERRAAQVTPAVARASAGAVEHLPVARVANLADWLERAKTEGAWIYGASAGATLYASRVDLTGRVVAVLGSEGRGLRPRVASTCDELVALPVKGRVASLNVATSAAALVYEAMRQRGEA